MGTTFMLLAILGVSLASGFLRLSLGRWTVAVAVTLGLFTLFGEVGGWTLFFSWLVLEASPLPSITPSGAAITLPNRPCGSTDA